MTYYERHSVHHRLNRKEQTAGGRARLAGLRRRQGSSLAAGLSARGRAAAGHSPARNRARRGARACGARVYPRVQAAVQRAGIDRRAGRRVRRERGGARARRPPVRLGAASARSSPVPALRRAGVSPRAPGGGGEPRAARPRAGAAAARSRSAPQPARPARGGRRARSQAPAPRLRPVFLWASQRDGAVQRVRCEDYDPRNRIHLTRTPGGWQAYPRTDTFDAIRRGLVPPEPPPPSPPPPPPGPRDRRRRRAGRPRRAPEPGPAWLAPDLESHIPEHRIAVPQVPPPRSSPSPAPASSPDSSPPSSSPPPSPPPATTAPSPRPPLGVLPPAPEPTPLDSLLAVAELELNQQRGSELEMAGAARFAFLPPEEAPDALFALGDDKSGDADDAFRDDLFESISDAHYLPELGGHDEALIESLVEKGCEDNQILGRLDRLSAQLETDARYEDELLGDAPVADIINRLESLESPSRSAAQGLLHLRHLPTRRPSAVDPFVPDEVFAPEPAPGPPEPAPPDSERRLRSDGGPAEVMYTEQMPDLQDEFDYGDYEDIARPSEVTLVRSDVTSSEEATRVTTDASKAAEPNPNSVENDLGDIKLDDLAREMGSIDFKLELPKLEILKEEELKEEFEKATDLTTVLEIDAEELPAPTLELPAALGNITENEPSDKNDELPKDLSIHRRLSSSYASPRRIEIPRAPSRESDAMQSPQPSGIPAISSPEVSNTPTNKCKPSFLDVLYASTSPKMYTSEVTIQQCVPLNLGKHRKSASPTVSSCSDDIRNANKDRGEPQEKRVRRESSDLDQIYGLLTFCGEKKQAEANKKKKVSEIEQLPPLKQLELLKSNKNFNLPDPILVPRDRLNKIIAAPGKEIPALLMERPQLNMPEILQDPNFMGDPEVIVISLEQIRQLIFHQTKPQTDKSKKPSESDHCRENAKEPTSTKQTSKQAEHNRPSNSERTSTPKACTPQPTSEQANAQPRPIPSMGHLADDIDAANNAAYQMSWLPAYLSHLSQLEAVAACSQNAEFLKALSSAGAGYAGAGYAGLSQMFHPARFGGLPGAQMMPPMDYESRMQFAMWQEAVNAAHAQRHKRHADPKEAPAHADYASPYAQALLRHAAPAALAKHAARPFPAPPMQFYAQPPHAPANSYLQSTKQAEARGAGSPRPRISVKSLQELQQTAQAASASASASAARRSAHAAHGPRRREEPEVGSTTNAGELPPPPPLLLPPHLQMPPHPHLPMPPHPHDPAAFSIWHPLFNNQKAYTRPYGWTTVTATGD